MEFIPTTFSNSDKKFLSKCASGAHEAVNFVRFTGIDFAKTEQAAMAYWIRATKLRDSWALSGRKVLIIELPISLSFNKMTNKEIEIQKALGTLSYKEHMKLKGILLENDWWYFPVLKNQKYKVSKTITIDDHEHYPVVDDYINDLHHSLSHNKYTEEKFADEIISQCYSCMSLETIDH